MKKIYLYLEIGRPDNWTKNLLIFPGFILAYALTASHHDYLIFKLIAGFISVSFICSANYTINEWLDREYDKFHPEKKFRHSVISGLEAKYIYLQYLILTLLGLLISYFISFPFLLANCTLLLMGIFYNVKPFRTKDHIYVDVLSEAINNPIRLLLGWFIVTSSLMPPISLVLAFWMGGAFIMGVKRYAELKYIKEPNLASQYRPSFKSYTEDKLLASCIFYATSTAIYMTVFMVLSRQRLIFLSPLYPLLFAWYLFIGLKPNSIAQYPERIYKEKSFFIFCLIVAILTICLLLINF